MEDLMFGICAGYAIYVMLQGARRGGGMGYLAAAITLTVGGWVSYLFSTYNFDDWGIGLTIGVFGTAIVAGVAPAAVRRAMLIDSES